MVEKNHKHEIGVEIAHHKETQRQLQKVGDDNRELKVKLDQIISYCKESQRFVLVCKTFLISSYMVDFII